MIQTIDISLIPSDNKPVINVSQFDNISRVLRFNVFDDLDMETPHVFDNGDTVLLNIRKNDNNIVVITGVIVSDIDPETQEITEQYITFELTEQACACVGSNFGEVSITSGDDEVIGSCNFKLIVERSPLSGGVSSQSAIDNLTTQIEQITEEVIGENYYDKEEIDGKFDDLDIPTKTSELENDSGFITSSDIPTIPTKTSQLTNDSGFITASDIPTIPTKTSQLTNDSGFITASDIPTIPTKTSQLTNDSGFITASALPTKTSQLTNDSGFITASDIPTIPTKTSQLTNDSGFTTIDDAAIVNDKTWSSNKINNELINLLPTAKATGNPANFSTSYALPLELIKAFIVAVQSSGTPTPANPLPIIGFDNVTITKADENMQTVETVVISLGQTVYGGYVIQDKAGNRQLVVTSILKTFDNTANWLLFAEGNLTNVFRVQYAVTNAERSKSEQNQLFNIGVLNAQAYQASDSRLNTCVMGTSRSLYAQVSKADFPSADDFKTFLSNTPMTVCYELAEPITISLSNGEPVNALLGVNNFSSNSGDCEVTYKCSINEAINAAIASQSNRTLSFMRTSETLEPIERGDNNDDNAR